MLTEVRSYGESGIEVRATPDGKPQITGYAAVFDAPSDDLGGFREKVAPGAFTKTIREQKDIVALFNHNRDWVLGRTSAKTARVWTDTKGLAYEATPPETTWAADLIESMKRGDIHQSSFSFRTVKDKWELTPDGEMRTLIEVKLYDVSAVTAPAYPQTSSDVRSAPDSGGVEYVDIEALDHLLSRLQRGYPLNAEDADLLNRSIESLTSLRQSEPGDHSDGGGEPAKGHSLELLSRELDLLAVA